MTEERLKEIKDSIDFQEKIANAYNCGDVVIVLNEERELYNEVVRLREIIKEAIKKVKKGIFIIPTDTDALLDILKQYNLTLEQLGGIDDL